ncbi:MAG: FHA domain-containing protein [Nitrospirae bacterium]|uniref:adenylate/guanylate cyclase domain-containing protein n=1 Tax=Candidatus Magnetobacterium casense TaxID=1455061 RepID=UPI0009DF28FE|nr:adenylate/guanylate cyclase domain-containing protein [Candidatus Magnetobacterium casensis]MBF0338557.1 FHA domain-containing protein [Nitrospirota bacterium]
MPLLRVKREGEEDEVIAIVKDVMTIGKFSTDGTSHNDISLDDKTVSRHHARISRKNDRYYIEDLRSKNHTYVNDQEVKRVHLKDGDVISIGLSTILFEEEQAREPDPIAHTQVFEELELSKTVDLNYLVIHQISEKLTKVTNLSEFYQYVMDMLLLTIKAEKCLLLISDSGGGLRCRACRGSDNTYSRSLVQRVLDTNQAVSTDSRDDYSTRTASRDVKAIICAPITGNNVPIGVIYLEDSRFEQFSENDLTLLTSVANNVSSGIERISLYEKIREEAVIKSNLERFLSPGVVAKVTEDSRKKGRISFDAEKLDASILFSDIKGFTAMSERLDPHEIARLLNDYFEIMTAIVFRYEGTLDKYVGDAVMAVFGAPLPYKHHACNAVLAAIEMQNKLKVFKSGLDKRLQFDIRIGINTGEVVTGYMGSPHRMEYTVLGEAVNVAARLESLAQPGGIFIGKLTYEQSKDKIDSAFIGRIKTPKGEKDMDIYKVIGLKKS